jgi:hypothetical protein
MADPRMRRFRGPVAAFAMMVVLVMATAAVLFVRKIGLREAQVEAFYLGSPSADVRPRTLAGLLEVAVPHLLAVPLVLFVTLHLVAFASRVRRRPFALLAGLTFACALAGILAGFAIRWVWPGLAPLKIAAFVGLEGAMLVWTGLLVATALPASPGESPAGDGAGERPEAGARREAGAARTG